MSRPSWEADAAQIRTIATVLCNSFVTIAEDVNSKDSDTRDLEHKNDQLIRYLDLVIAEAELGCVDMSEAGRERILGRLTAVVGELSSYLPYPIDNLVGDEHELTLMYEDIQDLATSLDTRSQTDRLPALRRRHGRERARWRPVTNMDSEAARREFARANGPRPEDCQALLDTCLYEVREILWSMGVPGTGL